MKFLRTLLTILNLLLAMALVLTTLSGVVPPSRSVLPSIMAFGYLPLVAANLLVAIVWLLCHKWQCLIGIAAIAIRWGVLGMYVHLGGHTSPPDAAQHPQAVSLMTYNVHQFRGRTDATLHTDSIACGILGLVRRNNCPDILCLQEYAAPKSVNITDSLTLMGYNHYYGAHTAKNGQPYGTVVFSRMPITYVSRIDSEKILVELLHPTGERFRVCCLHMDSYRFDNTERHEIERMRHGNLKGGMHSTLYKVRHTILNHQQEWEQRIRPVVEASSLPMVVAGDLNDIPSSWLYRQLTKHLTDAFCQQGWGLSPTYNGGFPSFRIDMIFHSSGFSTVAYKRLRSNLSDHHAVLATLELTP